MIFTQNFNSPVGNMVIKSNGSVITEVAIAEKVNECSDALTQKAVNELKRYFDGTLTSFSFPTESDGTAFQKKVWKILTEIPYGETVSYGDIAEKIGGKRYSRAVGGAVNKNPVLIAIPCHRVIGADGSLTGFACGLSVKKYLLDLEKENVIEK